MSGEKTRKQFSESATNLILRCVIGVALMCAILLATTGTFKIISDNGILNVSGASLTFGDSNNSFNFIGRIHLLIMVCNLALVALPIWRKSVKIQVFLVIISILGLILREYSYSYIAFGVSSFDKTIAATFLSNPFNIIFIVLHLIALTALFLTAKINIKFTVYEITEMAIFIALAVLLDQPFMKIKLMSNGGSISFEWVPLIVIALRFGVMKGFIASGVIYGMISCIIGGYGIAFYPFDYLLAFGSIALIGSVSKILLNSNSSRPYTLWKVLILTSSIVVVTIIKMIVHVISGIIFWETEFIPSLVYNAPPALITGCITLVAMLILFGPLVMINKRFPVKR